MQQWKNFENRSIFGKDMEKILWLTFWATLYMSLYTVLSWPDFVHRLIARFCHKSANFRDAFLFNAPADSNPIGRHFVGWQPRLCNSDRWEYDEMILVLLTCTWCCEVYRGSRRPWSSCSCDHISVRPCLFDECWSQHCPRTPAKPTQHNTTFWYYAIPYKRSTWTQKLRVVSLT